MNTLKKLMILSLAFAATVTVWGRSFTVDLRSAETKSGSSSRARMRLTTSAFQGGEDAIRVTNLDAGAADVGEVAVGDVLTFTLFDDVTLILTLKEQIQSPLGGDVFLAEVAGYEGITSAVVLNNDSGLTISVQDFINRKMYKVVSSADGVKVAEAEPSAEACCANSSVKHTTSTSISANVGEVGNVESSPSLPSRRLAASSSSMSDSYVDILVAYDRSAELYAEENYGGMVPFAQVAVAKMNTALYNSGISAITDFRFRLSGVVNVAVKSYTVVQALDAVVGREEGWRAISEARDAIGADIVCVMIDPGSAGDEDGFSGVSYGLDSSCRDNVAACDDRAFNVCTIRSVDLGDTMTHECGHNMGAGHAKDQETSPGPQLYEYSAGYRFSGCCTVMAYPQSASETRIPYFSSPRIIYRDGPVGVVGTEDCDNARTLKETCADVSTWRERKGRFLPLDGTCFGSSSWQSVTILPTPSDDKLYAKRFRDGEPIEDWFEVGARQTLQFAMTSATITIKLAIKDGDDYIPIDEATYYRASVDTALGNQGLIWENNSGWRVCETNSVDGFSAQVDVLSSNYYYWDISTRVVGPCTMSFDAFLAGYLRFRVLLDDEEAFGVSPVISTGWETYYIDIPEGEHTVNFGARSLWDSSLVAQHVFVDRVILSRTSRPVMMPATSSESDTQFVFRGEQEIELHSDDPTLKVYYTTDGSDPRISPAAIEYLHPFVIDKSTTVSAVSYSEATGFSVIVRGMYRAMPAETALGDVRASKGMHEDGVLVRWRRTVGAERYIVYRSIDCGEEVVLSESDASSYWDATAPAGKTARYRVEALSGSDEVLWSAADEGWKLKRESGTHRVIFDLDQRGVAVNGASQVQYVNDGGTAIAPTVLAESGRHYWTWKHVGWHCATNNITRDVTIRAKYSTVRGEDAISENVGGHVWRAEVYDAYPQEYDESLNAIVLGKYYRFNVGNYYPRCCARITSVYPALSGDVTVPATINGVLVCGMKNNVSDDAVFKDNKEITSVNLPCSMLDVGDRLFCGCTALESVTLGQCLKSVPEVLFSGCSSLLTVAIPATVTEIGNAAFSGCESLVHIDLPPSIGKLPSEVFKGCSSLRELEIPAGVASIASTAFDGCRSLGRIDVADGNAAFSSCDGVLYGANGATLLWCPVDAMQYTFPDEVLSVADGAFSYCTNLVEIAMPDRITYFGKGAFMYCDNLTSVRLPKGTDTVPQSAFRGCSSLASVAIPNGVTGIGDNAFNGCSGLTSVTVPNSVAKIGRYAFNGCKLIESVTIPSSVTNISDVAFGRCSSLKEVKILSRTTNMVFGDQVFFDDNKLKKIDVEDIGAWLTVLVSGSMPRSSPFYYGARLYIDGAPVDYIEIPAGTESIKPRAFYGCSWLMGVTIPNSVTNIGGAAFFECGGLVSITIGDGVMGIGANAFYGCHNLTTAYVPITLGMDAVSILREVSPSVQIIYTGDAQNCIVTFNAGGGSVDESARNLVAGTCITNFPIPRCKGYAFLGWFTAVDGGELITETSRIFEDMVLYAHWDPCEFEFAGDGNWSKQDDGTWKSGPIADGQETSIIRMVSGVGSLSFKWNVSSDRYDNLTFYIDGEAKDNISGTNYHPGETVGTGGWSNKTYEFNSEGVHELKWTYSKDQSNKAGYDCGLITDVVWKRKIIVDGGVLTIRDDGELTAVELDGATTITIPDHVTSIGASAFRSCDGLSNVMIPNGVTSIGSHAFDGCSELMSVTIPDSVTNVGHYAFRGCGELSLALVPNQLSNSVSQRDQFYNCAADLRILFYEGSVDDIVLVTVNFNANGGSIGTPSASALKGGGVGTLPSPTRDGYVFVGWFTAATGGVQVTAETVFNEDVTLCAHWEIREFDFSGNADWTKQMDGSWKSGAITHSQKTSIIKTVMGRGTLSFLWDVSSEAKYDKLTFYIDGASKDSISGRTSGWSTATYVIDTIGMHTLTWTYSKDFRDSSGDDCAWIKDVVWTPSAIDVPSVPGDSGAVVSGDAESGFTVKPSVESGAVEVTIPDGVDAAKVTVEVSPTVESVKANGASVRVKKGAHDITEWLDIPLADVSGVIDMTKVQVKQAVANEAMDISKGASVELSSTAEPTLTTSATKPGLTYTLREGTTLHGMADGAVKQGDGNPWTPPISVKGGRSGFYTIKVEK